jgi:hypothetical protein
VCVHGGTEHDVCPDVPAHHEHRPAGDRRRGETLVHGRDDRRGGDGEHRAGVVERLKGRAEKACPHRKSWEYWSRRSAGRSSWSWTPDPDGTKRRRAVPIAAASMI